jgi:putative spermidine/putrescine transport system permease protein
VAGMCTLICALFAYPYAYLMTLSTPRVRRLLLVLVLLPFWTSLMVRTYAWLVLLQDAGPIRALLDAVGLQGVGLIRTTTGVLIGMAQILLPFMVLPLYNNLQKIDRSHLLAAQSLGATPRRAFWRAYFPQSVPGLFAGSLLVFILALGFFVTPAILGSPQNSMMSQLIVRQVSERLDWASSGAMAVILVVMTMICLALASRFVRVQRAFGGGEGRT